MSGMSALHNVLLALRADDDEGAAAATEDADECGVNPTDKLGLRIGAIFIILVTSLVGTLFPVITKRTRALRKIVPGVIFEFGKFFGSGVILATALIHLLEPATDEIGEGNPCISEAWGDYPYPFAICLAALFFTFVGELFAFRIGTAYMRRRGVSNKMINAASGGREQNECCDNAESGSGEGGQLAPNGTVEKKALGREDTDDSRWKDASELSPAEAQILGVFILEFGVLFHSVIIGLTLSLADPDEFTTLFIVIIFHQMFEGLGLGTRLSFLQLSEKWSWVPLVGSLLYSIMTPLGMAIGLGTRESTSMTSGAASIASGILDATSAGILLYAATVELIAHEFIFSTYYQTCSNARVCFVLVCFALGAALMALLGKWA